MLMMVITAIIVIVGFSKPLSLADVFSHGYLTFPEPGNIFSECDNFASVIIRQFLQKISQKKAGNL